MQRNIITLSLAAYPTLVAQLTRLILELERDKNNPLVALMLFGSVARLMAGQSSDADLLALRAHDASEEQAASWLIRHIRAAEDARDDAPEAQDEAGWHMIPVIGDAQASDLDPDFLEGVKQDGVLLYQRSGAVLPASLAALRTFAAWRIQVSELIAALRLAEGSHLAPDDVSTDMSGHHTATS